VAALQALLPNVQAERRLKRCRQKQRHLEQRVVRPTRTLCEDWGRVGRRPAVALRDKPRLLMRRMLLLGGYSGQEPPPASAGHCMLPRMLPHTPTGDASSRLSASAPLSVPLSTPLPQSPTERRNVPRVDEWEGPRVLPPVAVLLLSPLRCTAGCSLQLRPYATMSPAIERTVVLQLLSFPQHDVMCAFHSMM